MTDAQIGQLLAVASALSFALASTFVSRTTASGGDKGVMFSVLVTVIMSAALWAVLEAGQGLGPMGPAEWRAIGMFALAGILANVFGRTLVFESIRRLGVSRASSVKRLNPFFSVGLAALLLGEAVSTPDLWGMLAIGLAFGLLMRESLSGRAGAAGPAPPLGAYSFGVLGALAYAATYITRKSGLEGWSVPALGTLVSALAGFAGFLLLALVIPRQRANLMGMFRHLDRWIVAASVMVSAGQILLFTALAFEKVSTVVMIASLEIFLSILLAVVVFRTEKMPGPPVLFAAALATAGVLLVAMQ